MDVVELNVDGYPPAKGEAMSMLGAGHPHAPRVRLLLTAALEELATGRAKRLGSVPIGLEMTLWCRRDHKRGDATNYLGGVGDVLEDKGHRNSLEHLGELAKVSLYGNDRQIEEVRFEWRPAEEPAYRVRLRRL